MGVEEREHGSAGAFQARAFWLPKEGADAEEYEDAFAVSEKNEPSDSPFRAAVADGATESIFAGRWARLLAEGFTGGGPSVLGEALPQAQTAWAEGVDAGALPWYAAAKAADGAFAALLGLELRRQQETWEAASVGDSNLFHLREDALLRAWPHEEAGQFGSRPALVPSRPGAKTPEAHRAEGTFQPGDAFVLATDAAAAWLLRTDPARALRWQDQGDFAEAARAARAENRLTNDDTTAAVIEVT